ncbi:MAG: exopolyphosphatase [Saprospiraceae bacterium]
MTGERIAVIDLGSNTFHLLICEVGENGEWTEIHKEREYVKLASGGIQIIYADAEQRAIDAMLRFANLIKLHQVNEVRAIGTAAMREANNAEELSNKLLEITGIRVEIIDGHQEARYILKGTQSALPELDEHALIMDIGGGSVEFILFREKEALFTGSFKIGVAILFDRFHKDDPISEEEILKVETYLDAQLSQMIDTLSKIENYYLIGASGSFEVLLEALPVMASGPHWAELNIEGLMDNLNKVIRASLAERRAMPEIPDERLDYIVVAYLLIRYLFKKSPPQKLFYCDFALKEGVIADLIENI